MQNDQGCFGIPRRQNPPRSQLEFNGYGGYPSVDTKIPEFLNNHTNIGMGMTILTNNAVNGLSILINVDGVYSISMSANSPLTSVMVVGISKNASATDRTTNIDSVAWGTRLNLSFSPAPASGSGTPSVSWTGFLRANDVIRPHTNAQTPNNTSWFYFGIAQVS